MATPAEEKNNPAEEEEKKCRICLDGPDVKLGRLIRPCLCKGSISYVHVKCLQQWRNVSTSSSAFYLCPQCHYEYAFARTRAFGMATNPVFIAALAAFFFTCIVFCASFVATYFVDLSDDTDTGYGYSFYYYSYYTWPWDVAKRIMKIAFNFLTDEDIIASVRSSRSGLPPLRYAPKEPSTPPSLFMRFVGRFILGLPVVGAASIVHLLSSMSLLAPVHWMTSFRRYRSGNRRDSSRDIAALLVLVAIAVGAARALWQVYKMTEKFAKRLLLRAEDAILEVNS